MSAKQEETVAIKASDLKDIVATAVATAIAETRKPSEKELKEIAARQEERRQGAAEIKEEIANRKAFQAICSHGQNRGRDQSKSAMVFVNQDFPKMPGGGKYFICQQCQAKVVPGPAPKEPNPEYPEFIYDTALWNKHLQMQSAD